MYSKKIDKELELISKEKSVLHKKIDLLQQEISVIEQKIIPIEEEINFKDNQYENILKLVASSSDTSSETLVEMYELYQSYYEKENLDGDIVHVNCLDYNLEEELSKNINTTEEILLVISQNYEAYSSDIRNDAEDTMARQSLLIAQDRQSTTEELNDIYLYLDETYIALSVHPNTSTKILDNIVKHKNIDMYMNILKHKNVTPKILDKMSCIYDEVDELILKHPKVYVKTKKKINRKR